MSNLPLPSVDSIAPEPLPNMPPRLASRGQRFAAASLDVLTFIPLLIGGIAARKALGFHDPMVWGRTLPLTIWCAMTPLFIVQSWLVATTGQTPGKRWVGIRIVRIDGSPVDFVRGVVLRLLVLWSLNIALYIAGLKQAINALSFVDIGLIFGRDRRTLRDRIAGTMVIQIS